jgi:hypothetical protein
MPFVDRTPSPAPMLRYAQVMPLMSALQALVVDGPTSACRAQALALSACRVLMPPAQAAPTEAHDAYIGVLRALLAVPREGWPAEGLTVRASAEALLSRTSIP